MRQRRDWARVTEQINDLLGTEFESHQEKAAFLRVLRYFDQNITETASALSMPRRTLGQRLQRLKIEVQVPKTPPARPLTEPFQPAIDFDQEAWEASGKTGSPCRHCARVKERKEGICIPCIYRLEYMRA